MSGIILRRDKGERLTKNEVDDNFHLLDTIPNGKTFPKEEDKGIKIDNENPDFGWHDNEGIYLDPTQNPPDVVIYVGGICERRFRDNQDLSMRFHIKHDHKLNADNFVHIHWSHNSDKVTGGSITWGLEVSYAKGHNQGAFCDTIVIPITQDASIISRQHLIAETALSVLGGSNNQLKTEDIEVDGIVLARVFLISNDLEISDESEVHPFFHAADIHYQSTGLPTKNKEPNFYGD